MFSMVKMKKILGFTSIRSDYDLMSPLYRLLNSDPEIDFKLLVSGTHLSHSHGYSADEIDKDRLPVLIKLETLLDSDTRISRLKSASILLQSSIDLIAQFSPDIMIFAGDREDVLIYAMIGGYLGIPTIHFFSGDHVKDGYIDNPIRHATSKLSTYHFVSLEQHKLRLIKMGESADRVFTVGNMSLDNFKNFHKKTLPEIKGYFNCRSEKSRIALLIFHPHSEEINHVGEIFENILLNLKKRDLLVFVSFPNTDYGNSKLIDIINRYKEDSDFVFYKNLDRNVFLSIYENSEFIIGNSSSGVCEAASFGIPAINVGYRQTGRFAGENVIFCKSDFESISMSIDKALSKEYSEKVKTLKNPYGDGNSSQKSYDLIKTIDFKKLLLKKEDPLEENING